MGLRRGFMQAGAQNILTTLWPISDETTINIMRDFYAAIDSGGHVPEALSSVQRRWLIALRTGKAPVDPGKQALRRGLVPANDDEEADRLLRAVRLAGPFVITFQGKP